MSASDSELMARLCARILGEPCGVQSVERLGIGRYNDTFAVNLRAQGRVVLRFAPEPSRQFTSERELMRNEYATLPHLAPVRSLMPEFLGCDFTHELVGRDVMLLRWFDGVPALIGLVRYDRSLWPEYYRELGTIARQIHDVRGAWFGDIDGPGVSRWRDAFAKSMSMIADDVRALGIDARELSRAAAVAHSATELDVIVEPRLLVGDLWTANVLLDADASTPRIVGILDLDRGLWGDPAADWSVWMAGRVDDERRAFWSGYGREFKAGLRTQLYAIRHLGALLLEHSRLGESDAAARVSAEIARTVATLG